MVSGDDDRWRTLQGRTDMITRRAFLRWAAGLGLATAGYALGIEPGLRLIVKTHRIRRARDAPRDSLPGACPPSHVAAQVLRSTNARGR